MNNQINLSEDGFYDSVGGYHEAGVSYAPNGEFCGECCRQTCKGCCIAKKLEDSAIPQQARAFITSRFEKVI